jgi:hypothetical protein
MNAQDFATEYEHEQARGEAPVENIVTLYRGYRDATLWGALAGNFDFTSDQAAYAALVTGNAYNLRKLTTLRLKAVGKVGFHTTTTDKRRAEARTKLDAERGRKA